MTTQYHVMTAERQYQDLGDYPYTIIFAIAYDMIVCQYANLHIYRLQS